MSGQLIFDEQTMIDGSLFKFEQRLNTPVNRYVENGMILSTYFSQSENDTTVDRGSRDIDELFGKHSPLRHIKIINFPLSGFGQTNPENTDEAQIEDINVEGDCTIIPSTIVPKQLDFFIINHLKMTALFQVTAVTYDSMKVNGFYKIHYRLISTSEERIQQLENTVIRTTYMDLNAIGTDMNPIIREDDYIHRKKVQQMVNQMIRSYRALFYNDRHNCFLYHDKQMGLDWFDMCGNEFIAKHSLMNPDNSSNVIVLNDKIHDIQMPMYYNNSIYNWLELGAPARLLQKFHFVLNYADGYPTSSFARWNNGDVQIMQPLAVNQVMRLNNHYSYFDDTQLNAFLDKNNEPINEYDKLIWKFINKRDEINIHDVSLYTADALISSIKHIDVFIYTPIIIYIIRNLLMMN